MLGQIPTCLVTAVGRPVAFEWFGHFDMPALERISPTSPAELFVDREGRTADKANLLVAQLKQMIHKQQRAAIVVRVDRGYPWVSIHGDDDRADTRQRLKRLKVGRQSAHADDDAIHRQRCHAASGLGKRKLLGLGHLDQRDSTTALAGRTGNAVDHRQVTELGDVVNAQPDRMVAAVAQRATGVARTETELLHGCLHALTRLLVHVGQSVGNARNRLLRNTGSAGNVSHGNRTRTRVVGRALCHKDHLRSSRKPKYPMRNCRSHGRLCCLSIMLTYSTIPISSYAAPPTPPEYRSRLIFDRLQESEEVRGSRL